MAHDNVTGSVDTHGGASEDININDNSGDIGTVICGGPNAFGTGPYSNIRTNTGNVLDLLDQNETVGNIQDTGIIENEGVAQATLTITGGSGPSPNPPGGDDWEGVIQDNDGMATGTVAVVVAGTSQNLSVRGANTFTGPTTVDNTDTLQLNQLGAGASWDSNVTVLAGGKVQGGTTTPAFFNGSVTSTGGTVHPGFSPGILYAGSLSLNATSTFAVDVNAPEATAGTDYGQVQVGGPISLGGTLTVTSTGASPADGTVVTIISNLIPSAAVSGTFAGLPEGATVTASNGDNYTISYVGGSGHDVTLTKVAATPIAVTSVVVNGNPGNALGGVDPNTGFVSYSRVATLYVTFNQAVQFTGTPFVVSLHPNVIINGVSGQMVGTVPAALGIADAGDHTHYTITFVDNSGATVNNGADYNTIFDGVYDFTVNATSVHPFGNNGVNMPANNQSTFFAMFGSTGQDNIYGNPLGNGGSTVTVGVDDAFNFSAAFGQGLGQSGYDQTLDFEGEGTTPGGSIGVDAAFSFSANFGQVWAF